MKAAEMSLKGDISAAFSMFEALRWSIRAPYIRCLGKVEVQDRASEHPRISRGLCHFSSRGPRVPFLLYASLTIEVSSHG